MGLKQLQVGLQKGLVILPSTDCPLVDWLSDIGVGGSAHSPRSRALMKCQERGGPGEVQEFQYAAGFPLRIGDQALIAGL